MIAVVQRVSSARVRVEGRVVGEIGHGLLALVAAVSGDERRDVDYLADKLAHLRIFADAEGRMNESLLDVGGEALIVSQFTLVGDTRKGRRPSFVRAMAPEPAEEMIDDLAGSLRERGVTVACGEFGALMEVELVNDGPVTLLLDSWETRRGGRRRPGGDE